MSIVPIMANFVYIATSLDGFIATIEGGLDWLYEIPNPTQSDYGYAEFMAGIDAIVMGRNTFEMVLTFDAWPYNKPVFVLSNTLKTLPNALFGKAEIISGEVRSLVASLHDRGYENLYIDGGKVIQSFLQADLIDTMVITRVPILLGEGISLFGTLSDRRYFTHQKTEILGEGLVKSVYQRSRGGIVRATPTSITIVE
jgi:dihydrofolate reductase